MTNPIYLYTVIGSNGLRRDSFSTIKSARAYMRPEDTLHKYVPVADDETDPKRFTISYVSNSIWDSVNKVDAAYPGAYAKVLCDALNAAHERGEL